jgi:hypothetical protein
LNVTKGKRKRIKEKQRKKGGELMVKLMFKEARD